MLVGKRTITKLKGVDDDEGKGNVGTGKVNKNLK